MEGESGGRTLTKWGGGFAANRKGYKFWINFKSDSETARDPFPALVKWRVLGESLFNRQTEEQGFSWRGEH